MRSFLLCGAPSGSTRFNKLYKVVNELKELVATGEKLVLVSDSHQGNLLTPHGRCALGVNYLAQLICNAPAEFKRPLDMVDYPKFGVPLRDWKAPSR